MLLWALDIMPENVLVKMPEIPDNIFWKVPVSEVRFPVVVS
jgi:hypothetical protein